MDKLYTIWDELVIHSNAFYSCVIDDKGSCLYPEHKTFSPSYFVIALLSLILIRWVWTFIFPPKYNPDKYYDVKPLDSRSWKAIGRTDLGLDDVSVLYEEMQDCADGNIAKPIWKRLEQLKALRRLFDDHCEEIIDAVVADHGNPRTEADIYNVTMVRKEIAVAIKSLWKWIQPVKKGFNLLTMPSSQAIFREPYGLALIIGTWNLPVMLTVWPLVGAIAGGNCCVLKPSNLAPHTAAILTRLIAQYLDPKVVSTIGTEIPGDRKTTSALLTHHWDYVFFTGSPAVGRVIGEACGRNLTPCTLELGGKNPVVVAKDANLRQAARRIVFGRYLIGGQQCIAPDYVLADEAIVPQLLPLLKEEVLTQLCNGPDSVGKVINSAKFDRLVNLLSDSKGEVIVGGGHDSELRYIEPTVLLVNEGDVTLEDEIFGCILPVLPVRDVDHAIRHINAGQKPLSAYFFTSSKNTQHKLIHNTSSGAVCVNGTIWQAGHPELPFGGVGESGMGAKYHGKNTFDCFTHEKGVLWKWNSPPLLADPFFSFPPWTPLKHSILRALIKTEEWH